MDLFFFQDYKLAAETALKLKQKEILFTKHFDSEKELVEFQKTAKKEKISIKFCHLLEKPDEKEAKQFKQFGCYTAVRGGNVSANKFACSSKNIDFLLQPVGRERLEFDSALANSAGDNSITLAILFSDFLNASQYDLVSLFRNHFLLCKICKRAGTKLQVFSGANSALGMRSVADLDSFLALLQQQPIDDIDGEEDC